MYLNITKWTVLTIMQMLEVGANNPVFKGAMLTHSEAQTHSQLRPAAGQH